MTLDERRTHMWQAIVRRVFALNDDRQRAKWLRCFTQSVLNYLDNPIAVSPSQSLGGFVGEFGHQSLLKCKYEIAPDRSQFDLLRPDWHAQYGIDTTVFAPVRETQEQVDGVTAEDIGYVLRGMIEHPRTHLHVYDETDYHELRVGAGLAEPYLFLFQLRFQLNLDASRREAEVARLRDIFTPAWFQQRDVVAPTHLFGLR